MDLIYIILSIYLRLFQTALPMSRVPAKFSRSTPDQTWAVWIPLVGWVSVVVRYAPHAAWLTWQVTSVQRTAGDRRKRLESRHNMRSAKHCGSPLRSRSAGTKRIDSGSSSGSTDA